MIDRRIAFAAGVTLALLAARVSAQSACTVTLVYPDQTMELSSNECYFHTAGHSPIGFAYETDLVGVVSVGYSGTVPWQYFPPSQALSFVTVMDSDFNVLMRWNAVFINYGLYMAPNTVFTGGFDQ